MDQVEALLQQLEKAQQDNHQEMKPSLLKEIEKAFSALNDFHRSTVSFQHATTLASAIKDRQSESALLNSLGNIYRQLALPYYAIGLYEHALMIAREVGDLKLEGDILNNLGLIFQDLHEFSPAIKHAEQALLIAQNLGDREAESATLLNSGTAYAQLKEYQRAIADFDRAIDLAPKDADTYYGKGWALEGLGRKKEAQQAYRRARELGYNE